jgi:transcriptional regulator GlxA family with amidase domain
VWFLCADRRFLKRALRRPDSFDTVLTAHLKLSARHVRRLFEQHVGCTFAVYLRALRIEAAQDLLQDGSVDIKEVSWRIGYRSPSRFSKEFRMLVGYTPTRYQDLVITPKSNRRDVPAISRQVDSNGRFAIAMAGLR